MVPTGAGMVSPHPLHRMAKSQSRGWGSSTQEQYRRTLGERSSHNTLQWVNHWIYTSNKCILTLYFDVYYINADDTRSRTGSSPEKKATQLEARASSGSVWSFPSFVVSLGEW